MRRSFSLVLSTYGKFILVLISSSRTSVGYLWLAFVAVTEASCVRNSPNDFANAFLIPIFTCFILSFSLFKSSLFVIIQYVLCSTLVNLNGL